MSTDKSKKPPLSPVRREQNRREFIRSGVLVGGTLIAALAGFVPIAGGGTHRLRPPGALKDAQLSERDFLSACIKCGQCVQVCPVEAIKLADLADGYGVGVPYIEARAQACDFSCDGLQCVLACPTGALTHSLNYPSQTRMGFARVARPDTCLAVLGKGFKGQARGADFRGELRFDEVDRWNPIPVADHPYDLELCDLCVRQCPIEIRIAQCEDGKPPSGDQNQCPPRHAIRLQPVGDGKAMLPIIEDGCVGCGVCEMICPVEETVIVIDLDKTADTLSA
ncbi:MAG: 4Fe-4S dicluster domain-containing protein [Chromatiaceae bacterium]|nr:4Fe-4S dicluster domain-containing protein [Gammaproteobacteria bacterium]MCP5415414.1 4Fe-4S dicluster domain-containing protein [Chromatiaceae bacterium]MCP5436968.1 4Fe-4S dicluster domain-containing protein [Chromatiaceae bacterium]